MLQAPKHVNVLDVRGADAARSACAGACKEARGIRDDALVPGAGRGTMDQLAAWTVWADKVLVF